MLGEGVADQPRRDTRTGMFAGHAGVTGGLLASALGADDTPGELVWSMLRRLAPLSSEILQELLRGEEGHV